MEKALAGAMVSAGYRVMNAVNCRTKLDAKLFASVRRAFASYFKELAGVA